MAALAKPEQLELTYPLQDNSIIEKKPRKQAGKPDLGIWEHAGIHWLGLFVFIILL